MKLFNYFFLLVVFCFFAACSDGAKRIVPEENNGESINDGESGNDEDASDSSTDPSDTEDDNADSGDDADTADTSDSGDHGDSSDDGDSSDSGSDTDNGDTDSDDSDTADSSNDDDSDTGSEQLTQKQRCEDENGTWVADAPDSKKCQKTVTCEELPENAVANGDTSYVRYYDFSTNQWSQDYPQQYGEGDPKPCQYMCAEKTKYEDNKCKLYCSAVFNGVDSAIEIAAENAPNLDSETWTVEAWIKQAGDKAPSDVIPTILIKRKGDGNTIPYFLGGYYNNNSVDYIRIYADYSYKQGYTAGTSKIDEAIKVPYSSNWTHVAMVQNKETSDWGTETYKMLVFVNGEEVLNTTYKDSRQRNVTPTIVTNDEPLIIGVNFKKNYYFTGLIDSIKISNTAKYTAAFKPAKLYAEGDTVAFWNFSGDATDDRSGKSGTETNIEYSTDCKE